ncbi:MAG: hypothetical protein JWN34_2814 [Bryobacterales bacterium]|nr:hypothetical protein [Bryobacterales bacterium]
MGRVSAKRSPEQPASGAQPFREGGGISELFRAGFLRSFAVLSLPYRQELVGWPFRKTIILREFDLALTNLHSSVEMLVENAARAHAAQRWC